jgi:hypothetical protein
MFTEIEVIAPPPQTERLVTVDEVARELGTGAPEAAVITALIDQASTNIQNYCHRSFAQARVKETWYTPVRAEYLGSIPFWLLYPNRTPIITVHEVLDLDDATVATADYRKEGFSRLRFLTSTPMTYSSATWKLSVEYTGGFSLPGWNPAVTPVLPEDITRAAILTVQQLYEMVGGSGSDLSQERIGDYTAVFGNSGRRMSGAVIDLLTPYRSVTVG